MSTIEQRLAELERQMQTHHHSIGADAQENNPWKKVTEGIYVKGGYEIVPNEKLPQIAPRETIEAIENALLDSRHYQNALQDSDETEMLALNILQAIQGGKVPRVRCDDARDREIQSLRSNSARWSLEISILKQILAGEGDELSGSDYDYTTEITDLVQALVRDRDSLRREVEDMTNDRDHYAEELRKAMAVIAQLQSENAKLREFWECFKPFDDPLYGLRPIANTLDKWLNARRTEDKA